MCALDLARINAEGVKAVISFHGTLLPLPDDKPEEQPAINASILAAHGDADTHISQEQVRHIVVPLCLPSSQVFGRRSRENTTRS